MPKLGSASFYIDAAERCARAFGQGALLGLGANAVGIPVHELPWQFACELGVSNAAICFLTCLSSLSFGDKETASFLPPPAQTPLMVASIFHKQ